MNGVTCVCVCVCIYFSGFEWMGLMIVTTRFISTFAYDIAYMLFCVYVLMLLSVGDGCKHGLELYVG